MSGTADLEEIHKDLLNDQSRQFDRPVQAPEVEPPPPRIGFWEFIANLIDAIQPVLTWLFWIGLAAIVAIILFFIAREFLFVHFRMRKKGNEAAAVEIDPNLRPSRSDAETLLADADALAAEGRFGEAVHLLLFRSIDDLKGRHDRKIPDALTSREVGRLPGLPDGPRRALNSIISTVESSHFGTSTVTQNVYQICRDAYEAFAIKEAWV